MQLAKKIQNNTTLRGSFNELAVQTFGLSFEEWYQNGYWADKNMPYVITEGDMVVANVSVNFITMRVLGQMKRYIQLGTVMTDTAHRHKGLSRRLMGAVLDDVAKECDALFLFANDSVLTFYPKFGFQKQSEYQYRGKICPRTAEFSAPTPMRRLDMESTAERELLANYYAKGNPFSAICAVDNFELLMFYCSAFMKDCVYFCSDLNAVVIAECEGGVFTCYEIFTDEPGIAALENIIAAAAPADAREIVFGFALKEIFAGEFELCQIDSDDTLFVWAKKENVFAKNRLMIPLLAHT